MIKKLFFNLKNSINGLKVACKENSFILELILGLFLIPYLVFINVEILFKLIIFVTYVILLALEIINSAIETLCNKITKEYDADIKKIKDLGSGAVFVILITLLILILASFVYNFINEQNLVKKTKLSEKEVIALFKSYKPLSELNLFVGSSVKETFQYLEKNLENECSLIYGNKMDIKGKIRVDNAEEDISNYLNEGNIQVICNGVNYMFLDRQEKLVQNEMILMVNVCNNIVLDYYLSTDLDVSIFGQIPKIFKDWLKYYKGYSSKEPVVEFSNCSELGGDPKGVSAR